MLSANDGSFAKEGNRLVIYDYVDNSTTPYFVDQIGPDVPGNNYGFTGVWPFVNGSHQWTPGFHKFFGWLAIDANMTSVDSNNDTPEEFFGTNFSYDAATKTLTIPTKAMTVETPQFDFLYSNIISTEPKQEPVGLTFSHLFTAFRITALNRDDASKITVKTITIQGLNKKSAEIVFSGNESAVTYTDRGNSSNFTFTINGTTGVLTTEPKDMTTTYLLWPQLPSDFADATISIDYDYTIDGQTSQNSRQGIPLGSTFDWKAGVINSLNIAFDVDQITFFINSLEEWNYGGKQDIVVGL